MRYSTAKEDGGYVKPNGEIQVIFIRAGVKHAEQGTCLEDHAHSKACAQAIMDVKPVIEPAQDEIPGDDGDPTADPPIAPLAAIPAKPAVLGPSMRQRGHAFFASLDARPADPVPVAMPQKTIKIRNDKGKLVDKQVDDGDLT